MNPTTESLNVSLLRHHNNLTAFHALVTGHMGMISHLARQWGQECDREQYTDMVGDGSVALCQGVLRFVQERPKCRVSTFVKPIIQEAILKHLYTEAGKQKPYDGKEQQRARKVVEGLQQKLLREPTIFDLEDQVNEGKKRKTEKKLRHFYPPHYTSDTELAVFPQDEGLDREKYSPLVGAAVKEFTGGGSLTLLALDQGMGRQELIDRLKEETTAAELIPP